MNKKERMALHKVRVKAKRKHDAGYYGYLDRINEIADLYQQGHSEEIIFDCQRLRMKSPGFKAWADSNGLGRLVLDDEEAGRRDDWLTDFMKAKIDGDEYSCLVFELVYGKPFWSNQDGLFRRFVSKLKPS